MHAFLSSTLKMDETTTHRIVTVEQQQVSASSLNPNDGATSTEGDDSEFANLHAKLAEYGQEHVLRFWQELSAIQRAELKQDILNTDLKLCAQQTGLCSPSGAGQQSIDAARMKPPDDNDYISVDEFHWSRRMADAGVDPLGPYAPLGLAAINKGAVAVLLMAGGQGTRLGVDYPKGMYDVGLPSKKTLYELQAERIIKVQNLAKTRVLLPKDSSITWYIMCSEATRDRTVEFFTAHKYFGLESNNVLFFEQRMLPAFTLDGKFILESKSKISKAPDGNGGMYFALKENGILDDMKDRGIQYVHVYGVDNVLVKVADPSFIGACIKKEVECGNKVVEKTKPDEAVGVVCRVDGKYRVVEYSEISPEAAAARVGENGGGAADSSGRGNGKLLYRAGNIVNHFFTLDFLQRVCSEFDDKLPFHVARKKIPYVDLDSGETVKPTQVNGVKLEKFVFDVFPFARSLLVYEVHRKEEFSPLKNPPGSTTGDNPETCRHDVYELHRQYLLHAGFNFVDSADEAMSHTMDGKSNIMIGDKLIAVNPGERAVEISPLLSYAGEDLTQLPNLGKPHSYPVVLRHPAEIKH